MDEIDITQERMDVEEARRRAAQQPVEIPKGEGVCLWCGEKLSGDGRWCDAGCRDSMEQHERLKGRWNVS